MGVQATPGLLWISQAISVSDQAVGKMMGSFTKASKSFSCHRTLSE